MSVYPWEAQILIQPMDEAEIWQRTRATSLDLQTVVFLMKPTGLLAFFLGRAQCLIMVNVVPRGLLVTITFLVTEVWYTALLFHGSFFLLFLETRMTLAFLKS